MVVVGDIMLWARTTCRERGNKEKITQHLLYIILLEQKLINRFITSFFKWWYMFEKKNCYFAIYYCEQVLSRKKSPLFPFSCIMIAFLLFYLFCCYLLPLDYTAHCGLQCFSALYIFIIANIAT